MRWVRISGQPLPGQMITLEETTMQCIFLVPETGTRAHFGFRANGRSHTGLSRKVQGQRADSNRGVKNPSISEALRLILHLPAWIEPSGLKPFRIRLSGLAAWAGIGRALALGFTSYEPVNRQP